MVRLTKHCLALSCECSVDCCPSEFLPFSESEQIYQSLLITQDAARRTMNIAFWPAQAHA